MLEILMTQLRSGRRCSFEQRCTYLWGESVSAHVQVCRGCRLVRYCSEHCQAAAWPEHKAVCRKYGQQGQGRAQIVDP